MRRRLKPQSSQSPLKKDGTAELLINAGLLLLIICGVDFLATVFEYVPNALRMYDHFAELTSGACGAGLASKECYSAFINYSVYPELNWIPRALRYFYDDAAVTALAALMFWGAWWLKRGKPVKTKPAKDMTREKAAAIFLVTFGLAVMVIGCQHCYSAARYAEKNIPGVTAAQRTAARTKFRMMPMKDPPSILDKNFAVPRNFGEYAARVQEEFDLARLMIFLSLAVVASGLGAGCYAVWPRTGGSA